MLRIAGEEMYRRVQILLRLCCPYTTCGVNQRSLRVSILIVAVTRYISWLNFQATAIYNRIQCVEDYFVVLSSWPEILLTLTTLWNSENNCSMYLYDFEVFFALLYSWSAENGMVPGNIEAGTTIVGARCWSELLGYRCAKLARNLLLNI